MRTLSDRLSADAIRYGNSTLSNTDRFGRRQLMHVVQHGGDLVSSHRTLAFVNLAEVDVELAHQVATHNVTPSFRRSRLSPRSAWVCTVVLDSPRWSATSDIDHW